jgi:drug/metabolite transporter (DMT)-like permease
MALMTPQAVISWSAPAWDDLLFFAGMGLFSAIGHLLSIIAFRLADASTLAPLVYIELIAAALIGYFVFGEIPGRLTIVGAGFIIAAGLVLLQRRDRQAERQVDRHADRQAERQIGDRRVDADSA